MGWAIITHPARFIKGKLMQVPELIMEDLLPTAVAQDWIVIARDSDVPELPKREMNLLSDPRRPPHGLGYAEPEDGA